MRRFFFIDYVVVLLVGFVAGRFLSSGDAIPQAPVEGSPSVLEAGTTIKLTMFGGSLDLPHKGIHNFGSNRFKNEDVVITIINYKKDQVAIDGLTQQDGIDAVEHCGVTLIEVPGQEGNSPMTAMHDGDRAVLISGEEKYHKSFIASVCEAEGRLVQ